MLPPIHTLSTEQRKLIKVFSRLSDRDRSSLLAFAEFLAARADLETREAESVPPAQPRLAPRPEKESVVGAIKRLSKSYPMLDRGDMLDETSSLMTSHVIQGRSAKEVIDDLEQLFAEHYRRYRDARTP